jgi:hypothetical protein
VAERDPPEDGNLVPADALPERTEGKPASRFGYYTGWWWTSVLVALVPQGFLTFLVVVQTRHARNNAASSGDIAINAQLFGFGALVFLFWALVVCGVLSIWRPARAIAAGLLIGSLIGCAITACTAGAISGQPTDPQSGSAGNFRCSS